MTFAFSASTHPSRPATRKGTAVTHLQATTRELLESKGNTSVIQFPIVAWARVNAWFQGAGFAVRLSRLLLLLVSIELATMPITQGLWTWDRFLHGGQDFELGMMIIFSCLCLILLHAEQSRCDLGLLVAIRALLANKKRRKVARMLQVRSCLRRPKIPSNAPPSSLNLPLLI
jgi:hypothetical protein